MKKILLVFVLIFHVLLGFSQTAPIGDYEIYQVGWLKGGSNHHCGRAHIEMTLDNNGTEEKRIIFDASYKENSPREYFYQNETSKTFKANQKLKKLYFSATRYRNSSCRGRRPNNNGFLTFSSTPSCYTLPFQFNGSEGFTNSYTEHNLGIFESRFTLYIRPRLRIVDERSQNLDTFITFEEKITIQSHTHFNASDYNWEYSKDGVSGWKSLNRYSGQSSISVDANDFLKDVNDKDSWKRIHVRQVSCDETVVSNTVYYDVKKTSPRIVKIEKNNPKCPGEKNGSIKVYLDKPLATGESLEVNRGLEVSKLEKELLPLDLDADYAFILGGLSAGTDSIHVAGIYKNASGLDDTMYSDGKDHGKRFMLIEPTAVSFKIEQAINISCTGANNGSIRISASGGAGGYRLFYKKSDQDDVAYQYKDFVSPNEITLTGLDPTEYEFYVMDKNDCFEKDIYNKAITKTQSLIEPDGLVQISNIEEEEQEPSGTGRSDGSMTVNITGGTLSGSDVYTVEWKNKDMGSVITTVESTSTINGFQSKIHSITAGTYIITATDSNGCVTKKEYTLDEPKPLSVSVNLLQSISCNGGSNGQISASATGGIGDSYSYRWYKINSVTDSISISSTNIANNLKAGLYRVYAEDSSSPVNISHSDYDLKEPTQGKATFTSYNVSCKNGTNGILRVTVTGGTPNYTLYYKLDGGIQQSITLRESNTVFSLTNLTAGEYTFYVRDGNGCIVLFNDNKQNASVTLNEPDSELEILERDIIKPSGAGRSDGSITIKIAGGVVYNTDNMYKILWRNKSNINFLPINTVDEEGVVTSKIEDLPKGTYTVTISDANTNGTYRVCTLTSIIIVDEPKPLTVSLAITKGVDCNNNETAQITASGKGGITLVSGGMPYTYKWYRIENGQATFIENKNDSVLNKIGKGVYKVILEDGSTPFNTTESQTITVTQPDILQTKINTQNISCFEGNDGKITIGVIGGVPNYKLFYKNKSSLNNNYLEVDPVNNTFTLSNLEAGTYSLYIKDNNECYAPLNGKDIEELELTQPKQALTIVSQIITPPTGAGRSDGAIGLVLSGGTPNDTEPRYNVVWKNSLDQAILSSETVNKDDLFVSSITDLKEGVYTVQFKDKNSRGINNDGCFVSATINLKAPDPLTVTLQNTKTVDCYGFSSGELVAHVKGGVPYITGLPYTYKWYQVIDGENVLLSSKNDSILTNIKVGSYKVLIEDGSSLVNKVESAYFEVTQPTEQKTEVTTRNVSCYGGSDGFIHISVSGGTGGHRMFVKRLQSETEYKEVVYDDATQQFIVNDILAGTYSVYILDENDCYAKIDGQDIASIAIEQSQMPLYLKEEVVLEASGYGKNDGKIDLVISGGTPHQDGTYAVIWKDSLGNILESKNSIVENGYKTVLSGLKDGKFMVEVRDLNYDLKLEENNIGCIFVKEFELIEPKELTVYIEEVRVVSCNGMYDGQLLAHADGGVPDLTLDPPYKYRWYKKSGDTYTLLANSTNANLAAVGAGEYRIEIEDFSRKVNTAYALFTVEEPEPLQAITQDVHLDECGQLARISVDVSGGTLPYTYEWNTGDSLSYIDNAHPGRYMVYVSDARGCDITAVVNVTSPGDLLVTGKVSDPICYEASNGNIVLSVSGGSGPYTYNWSNGATTKDLVGIPAGVYTVVVTEKDGCTFSESFELVDPEQTSVYIGADALICMGQEHIIKPEVEDPNTTFMWTADNGFQSRESEVKLSLAGTYSLTITDSKGCQASDQMTLRLTDYGISSEMVVATDVFLKDTVVFVNISYPDPDRVEWIIPEDVPARVVSQTDEMLQVIFDEVGQYSLGMRAHLKDCFQDNIKTVSVTDGEHIFDDNFGQSDVKEFVAYPNPSNGQFRVKVVLDKQVNIRLRMFSLGKGGLVDDRTEMGAKEYDLQYTKFLSAGAYILLLETPSGRKSFKVVIR